jgi:hypothetical protein|tara:strand:- start:269 stop:1663 length:1395 start_codon:yes stop_codon:yes gene_type:complete
MAIYLGSTQIDQGSSKYIYLGSQQICKAYLGTTQVFDNCGFTPVTVTMYYSGSPGGSGGSAGYTIGGPGSGSTQSGQAGVGTYSFTNTIAVNTGGGYSGSVWIGNSGNSTSTSTPVSNTLSGTIPSTNTAVYQVFGGSTTAPVTTFTDTYSVSKTSALTQGSVSVTPSSVGPATTGTDSSTVFQYTGASSGYTYTGIQIAIDGGSAVNMANSSGDGYTWTYSYSNTIGSSNRSIAGVISGTETASTQNYYVEFSRNVTTNPSQGEYDYSISGATGSGNTSGNLNSSSNTATTGSLLIQTLPSSTITIGYLFDTFSGGYQFTTTSGITKAIPPATPSSVTMPDVVTASSLSTSSGSPTTYTLTGDANPVADQSYGYGPYTSLSAACSDRNSGSVGASADFNYFNGGEGILPPYGTTISQTWDIDNGLGSPLTNFRWYVTEDQQDSNGDNIVFYYYNGIDNTVTCP